jgi:hypothetical protein
VGKAGFNLEFLPTLYFGKSYLVDDDPGIFPRHSDGPMEKAADGTVEAQPLATGQRIVLSPEDPSTRVTITSDSGPILLFDGRNKAQNGWFVVRTLIPAGKTGDVVVWHVRPNVIQGWTRPPVVGYNQVGYTPEREKVAVVELDPLFDAPKTARVLRLTPEGEYREVFSGAIKPWGKWMRYQYAHFDFSAVRKAGIYAIEICRAEDWTFSDRKRCIRRHLAAFARHVSAGADGPREGARGVSHMAWSVAPRRCPPGTRQLHAFRRVQAGPDDRLAVFSGTAHPGAQCRRVVRRG